MPSNQFPTLLQILAPAVKVIWSFFATFWWIIFPPALFFALLDIWRIYIAYRYAASVKWISLEIRVPQDIEKTPKAMEQVFAAFHASLDPPNFGEKWWIGRFQEWCSFEILGTNEGMRFFIRTPEKYKNLLEAAVYAQYPQSEILGVEDYADQIPQSIPNAEYDLWGTTMKLTKPDPYPIRQYEEFEESQEEKRLDPLSLIAEAMSHMKEGEQLWLQMLLKAAEPDWIKEGEKLVNKLIGKKEPPPAPGFGQGLIQFLVNLVQAPFVPPTFPEAPVKAGPEEPETKMLHLTPGQRSVVESIEKKCAKLAFHVNIKWIYLGRRDVFSKANIGMVMSYFRQFGTLNLNGFRPDKTTMTKTKYLFKDRRLYLKQRALFYYYKFRLFYRKPFILNTEELATLFHFPTIFVAAPKVIRIEAKKAGPPPTLPVAEK